MADAADEPSLELKPCPICTRTFRAEILERHEKVCEKAVTKKRRVFDSFKTRVQGTELAEFLGAPPLPGQPKRQPLPPPKPPQKTEPNKVPKWKQTHEALLATLRAARGSDDPSAAQAVFAADTEQCPTCGRCFGHRAFDRHVEFCKEVAARKARTPVRSSPAQERLEARTKYRAPLFRSKSKSSDISLPPAKPSSSHTSFASNSSPVRKPSPRYPPASAGTARRVTSNPSIQSVNTHDIEPLKRQGSLRSSLRLRGTSPAKSATTPISRRSSSPIKVISASSQPKIKPALAVFKELRPKTAAPPATYSYSQIMEAANEQMNSLLLWNSSSDIASQAKPFLSDTTTSLPTKGNNIPSIASSSSPLHTSPTSAFTPVNLQKENKNENLDENKNKTFNKTCDSSFENFNNFDDGNFRSFLTSTPLPRLPARSSTPRTSLNLEQRQNSIEEENKNRRNSTYSISSQRSDGTIADEGILWPTLEDFEINLPIKRSKKKSFVRSKSVFEDRNKMLFAHAFSKTGSSSEDELGVKDSCYSHNNPHPTHSLRAKSPLDGDDSPHDNKEITTGGGGDGDSAYSSLNRRSPRAPEILSQKKITKFCHECGSKYPLINAKFCCECGVRRLMIH